MTTNVPMFPAHAVISPIKAPSAKRALILMAGKKLQLTDTHKENLQFWM